MSPVEKLKVKILKQGWLSVKDIEEALEGSRETQNEVLARLCGWEWIGTNDDDIRYYQHPELGGSDSHLELFTKDGHQKILTRTLDKLKTEYQNADTKA